ncbi:MAG: sigma-70 family polymerase sigma factor [Ilumatobacteraceae bacterium]|nr:sigma-70 family polymerase sigma factor [Ilumatobacteraceae bacterium]
MHATAVVLTSRGGARQVEVWHSDPHGWRRSSAVPGDVDVTVAPGDEAMVARLRAGDGAAFRELVAVHHRRLVRLADTCVSSSAVAEEVVQETWIAVIKGIDHFEQRSSLKTWITKILLNIARTRGARERRTVPFAALEGGGGPAVDPARFNGPPGHGAWSDPPARWSDLPEAVAESNETVELVLHTVKRLPEQQKWVVMLRDVEGWSSTDVCDHLGISEANQRVLLHRGRSTVRAALEDRWGGR